MARLVESVRVNRFCPGQGQTLTQSLAQPEERSSHLETAPKHDQNQLGAGHIFGEGGGGYKYKSVTYFTHKSLLINSLKY